MPPSFGGFRLRFWQRGKRNSAWRVKAPHWGTPVYGHAGIVGFPSPFGHSCPDFHRDKLQQESIISFVRQIPEYLDSRLHGNERFGVMI